jgi:hypothetical protein
MIHAKRARILAIPNHTTFCLHLTNAQPNTEQDYRYEGLGPRVINPFND